MIKQINTIDDDGVIINAKNYEYIIFDSKKGYLFRSKNYFRKSYPDIKLSDIILNESDYAKVHKLAECIYKDTNTVMIRTSQRKVRIASTEDIEDIIGFCPRRTKAFLYRMKKLHVIAERIDKLGNTTITKYVLNPLFFNSNKYLSSDLYFLFKESLNCYLPGWVISKFYEMGNLESELEIDNNQ